MLTNYVDLYKTNTKYMYTGKTNINDQIKKTSTIKKIISLNSEMLISCAVSLILSLDPWTAWKIQLSCIFLHKIYISTSDASNVNLTLFNIETSIINKKTYS